MTMKNCEQLQQLSDEHQEALQFADEIASIAEEGSEAGLAEGIERVRLYYENELEVHLQHEEQTIFAPLVRQQEHVELCITLGKEHGFLRSVVEQMTLETAKQDLGSFAVVLRNHSLMEERELFPLLQTLFDEEQLDAVLNYAPVRQYIVDKSQAGATS